MSERFFRTLSIDPGFSIPQDTGSSSLMRAAALLT